MNKPIRPGDLVMVVKVHCDQSVLGHIFRVGEIALKNGQCKTCRTRTGEQLRATGLMGYGGVPLSYLKRIDPLSELDDVRQDEEIAA